MKSLLLKGATIVNEGREYAGDVLVEGEKIKQVMPASGQEPIDADQIVDCAGMFLLPGIIDEHVHFREPGMTGKANISSESRAAVAGGVTSFFDMPNTVPATTTIKTLEDKWRRAESESVANYSFFFGATNDNNAVFKQLDTRLVPGIKVFMGASTGAMAVDGDMELQRIFAESPLIVMTHCEDPRIVARNANYVLTVSGENASVALHSLVRSTEACYRSTAKAIKTARATHCRLHVAHISTAKELELFRKDDKQITAEVCLPHLLFSINDYERLGSLIKCNPSVKTESDKKSLIKALTNGNLRCVATDHAPHLPSEKQGGCFKAASGMPMVQFSLVSMLEFVDKGQLSLTRLAELMCHNPANLFGMERRGFIREGYQADLVLIKPNSPWTLHKNDILSRCKWSPLEGKNFNWRIERTYCNGRLAYSHKDGVQSQCRGQQITFSH